MMLLMLMLFLGRAEQSFRKSKHRATLVSAFSCRPLCLCCLSASVGDPIRFSSQRGMGMGYKQQMKIPMSPCSQGRLKRSEKGAVGKLIIELSAFHMFGPPSQNASLLKLQELELCAIGRNQLAKYIEAVDREKKVTPFSAFCRVPTIWLRLSSAGRSFAHEALTNTLTSAAQE